VVDRQQQVVAGDRFLALQDRRLEADALDASPLGIDEQLLVARFAMQHVLVKALEAELADQRRAGVLGNVDAFLVLLADRAHVPQRMHPDAGVRIRVA
jgi:hypothetical protein